MHISATPNPFEQLTKSNRVRAKTFDQPIWTGKNKLVGYHAEADILLDRRSSILAKIANEAGETMPPEKVKVFNISILLLLTFQQCQVIKEIQMKKNLNQVLYKLKQLFFKKVLDIRQNRKFKSIG